MLLLFLDTGLRLSELLTLPCNDLHIRDQWLKVMGKAQKERMVPFGSRAAKLLQRYIYCFRPEPVFDDRLFLCVNGTPMTENTIRLVFARLAKRAGVPRLHIHLLRHTFATRYLLDRGDVFTLQRILGHSTLEMTRRYVDMVAMEVVITEKRFSAMDRLLMAGKASHDGEQSGTQRAHRGLVGPPDGSTYHNSYKSPRSRR